MLAQRRPRVALAEHTAALQLGHDHAHDVLVGTRHVGGGDDEAVARVALEPLLHLVGDLCSRTHEARSLEQRGPVTRQVGEGDRVSADVLPQVLDEPPDARHRLDELVGYRRVELEAGEVVVHQLREQGERSLRVDKVVEEHLLALLGLGA